ncbi:hypothetical protein SAMN04488071_3228 [Kordiimonas lacus]|uniref:Apea-like HEPN domain-containing protein n=2 Tax=Kordiimonas lacus TaxID=637679 RepID=A0A1G7E0E1_9PROT|nr:hypothetical protein SAMN04488071_3228 [Kordiimonas lacus]
MDTVPHIEELENSEYFFRLFCRFEFAIKKSGVLLIDPDRALRRAEIDWVEFSRNLPEQFFGQVAEMGVCPTILSEPPKRQVVDQNRKLIWQDVQRPQNTQMLFECLRNIRNNLFHGGKSGDPTNKPRNETLIAEGIRLIEFTLDVQDELRLHFNGGD